MLERIDFDAGVLACREVSRGERDSSGLFSRHPANASTSFLEIKSKAARLRLDGADAQRQLKDARQRSHSTNARQPHALHPHLLCKQLTANEPDRTSGVRRSLQEWRVGSPDTPASTLPPRSTMAHRIPDTVCKRVRTHSNSKRRASEKVGGRVGIGMKVKVKVKKGLRQRTVLTSTLAFGERVTPSTALRARPGNSSQYQRSAMKISRRRTYCDERAPLQPSPAR
ncbi:hypothetical protein R3P38DRAFT_3270619 [Favolaschia claudopus]|uniref:Uncharacterized protein n=1 Tax=Favolaschia claudopus TaxID=2862362 RepID=A0AAW0BCW3_9AGAR